MSLIATSETMSPMTLIKLMSPSDMVDFLFDSQTKAKGGFCSYKSGANGRSSAKWRGREDEQTWGCDMDELENRVFKRLLSIGKYFQ